VACFSYLAAATLWKVSRFPPADQGAEVTAQEESVAADGAMTAAVLAGLGHHSILLANNVGDDQRGNQACTWLDGHGVTTSARAAASIPTPQVTVVTDDNHTRTFFPYLPGVARELEALDLRSLASASFAYIDGYQLIARAASSAIQAARAAGVPLLLNLGGDSPAEVLDAIRGYPRLIIQTSTTERSPADAQRAAGRLRDATQAQWIILTTGPAGAVAVSRHRGLSTPAFQSKVASTHCAGAAFSAGLIHGLLHDWEMQRCLDLACASGALRCERAQHDSMPTLDELQDFAASRERIRMPAA
jgi:sugar/nucleoside kinase (ribokinase family)